MSRITVDAHPSLAQPRRGALDAAYCGRRVVVLGAAGFIGRWVARELSLAGADVFLVVRHRAAAHAVFARYGIDGIVVELDLGRAELVRTVIEQIRPALTVNLAGYGVDRCEVDPDAAFRINARLVDTLSRAMAAVCDPGWHGLDLLHVASAAEHRVAGEAGESAFPPQRAVYAQSKLAGTRVMTQRCHALGLRGATARLFTVYGPGEHPNRLLPSLLHTARTRGPLRLTAGYQTRDFTYVRDVALGLLRLGLATVEPGEVVPLGTGRFTSVREFVETAAQALGIAHELLRFGELPTPDTESESAPAALERLRRLTAWVPRTTIRAGIAHTAAFYAARRWGLA